MRIAIAGAHGQIGRRLGRLLAQRGDSVVGIIRTGSQSDDLRADGVEPAVLDLESTSVQELAGALRGCDAAVFSAGAGGGSGDARKDSVDRAGAALLADACEEAGVSRYLLVSSMGVEQVRDGATPEGVDDAFVTYLRAKLAAEDDVRARSIGWTVLRPGRLTDDAGTGTVRLADHVDRSDVPRDDVATVLAALLDAPGTIATVLELTAGDTPVGDAVTSLA